MSDCYERSKADSCFTAGQHSGVTGTGHQGVGTGQHSGLTGSGQHSGVTGSGPHSGVTGQHSNLTGTGNHSGLTGSSHTGRDAAGLGAAGAVGEHEYRKHENTTGQHSNLTGTGQHSGAGHPSNLPGSGLSEASTDQSGHGIGGHSDRNRLHKDPSASHPASSVDKGGVPASGAERERLIGQGEQRLDNDSGVHNSGANASTNY